VAERRKRTRVRHAERPRAPPPRRSSSNEAPPHGARRTRPQRVTKRLPILMPWNALTRSRRSPTTSCSVAWRISSVSPVATRPTSSLTSARSSSLGLRREEGAAIRLQLRSDAVAAREPELRPDAVAAAGVERRPPGAAVLPDPPRVRPAVVEPLAPARYKVQFTASAELHDKLERLRFLMRSSVLGCDLAAIIEQAVTDTGARVPPQAPVWTWRGPLGRQRRPGVSEPQRLPGRGRLQPGRHRSASPFGGSSPGADAVSLTVTTVPRDSGCRLGPMQDPRPDPSGADEPPSSRRPGRAAGSAMSCRFRSMRCRFFSWAAASRRTAADPMARPGRRPRATGSGGSGGLPRGSAGPRVGPAWDPGPPRIR